MLIEKAIMEHNTGKIILVDAVHTLIVEDAGEFVIFEPMQALLDEFPNRKIVVTGADDEQFQKFNLGSAPYEVFTLKHQPEKTDPEYFRILLEQFHLSPDQAVYFEHDSRAVESAKSVGIASYFYDSERQDLAVLREFLTNNL